MKIAEVHNVIADYLKQAPYRNGGAGKGASLETATVNDRAPQGEAAAVHSDAIRHESDYSSDSSPENNDDHQ